MKKALKKGVSMLMIFSVLISLFTGLSFAQSDVNEAADTENSELITTLSQSPP